MDWFSVDCGLKAIRGWLVRVCRKGSLSVPGSSMLNLMCGSMELRYS